MTDVGKLDRPVNVGNPQMGWASDVAAEMLRRMGIKYLAMNQICQIQSSQKTLIQLLSLVSSHLY